MKPLTTSRRGRGTPLRRRRQMKTRRRWTWRSLLHAPIPQLVTLAIVLAALYVLATSRVFAITTVQVLGMPGRQLPLVRSSCGCVGANIFLTRPSAIQWRLGRLPWIEVRQVYARLPNRIVVDAAYRQPVAIWRTTAATYTVDASGEVLYDLNRPLVPADLVPVTATLPLVYSPHDTTFTSGRHVDQAGNAIPMILATRSGLPTDIARTIDIYRWSSISGLTAHSRLGWWFSLGINLHADLAERLKALVAAYRQGVMRQGHCNYVDLRVMYNGVYCRNDPQWRGRLGPPPH